MRGKHTTIRLQVYLFVCAYNNDVLLEILRFVRFLVGLLAEFFVRLFAGFSVRFSVMFVTVVLSVAARVAFRLAINNLGLDGVGFPLRALGPILLGNLV